MSRIIVPRRDLILPNRRKQGGFIINPYRFSSGGGGGGGGFDLQFDPANKSSVITLSSGNKSAETSTGGGHHRARIAAPKTAGKWMYEMTVNSMGYDAAFGLEQQSGSTSYSTSPAMGSGGCYWSRLDGGYLRLYDGSGYTSPSPVSGKIAISGDVITIGYDVDAKTMKAYRNGALVGDWSVSALNGAGTAVPTVALWGTSGTPTKVTINDTILHPIAGYTQLG